MFEELNGTTLDFSAVEFVIAVVDTAYKSM
jgi:hypothetical protein